MHLEKPCSPNSSPAPPHIAVERVLCLREADLFTGSVMQIAYNCELCLVSLQNLGRKSASAVCLRSTPGKPERESWRAGEPSLMLIPGSFCGHASSAFYFDKVQITKRESSLDTRSFILSVSFSV